MTLLGMFESCQWSWSWKFSLRGDKILLCNFYGDKRWPEKWKPDHFSVNTVSTHYNVHCVSIIPRFFKKLAFLCFSFPPKNENSMYLGFYAMAMATHSSTLARKIPRTEETGGLQSMGSLRVGHDWATSLSLFTFMRWRRKWQPTPAFLPGESQGRGSLVGCRLCGHTESDTTEVT